MPIAMRYGSGNYSAQGGSGASGGGGGMSMTLLWTNPSPSSNFSAQTVSLDLSGYDAVLINFIATTSDTSVRSSEICFMDETVTLLDANLGNSGNAYYYKRQATPSSTGIAFTNGYRGTNSGAGYDVPYQIYGIKGIT